MTLLPVFDLLCIFIVISSLSLAVLLYLSGDTPS